MRRRKKTYSHNIIHYFLTAGEYIFKGIIQGVEWLFVSIAGFFIFETKQSPYNILIGLPLFLVGIGFVLNNVITVFFTVLSYGFNKEVCRWCDRE